MPILIGLPVLVAIAVFAIVFLGGNGPSRKGSQDRNSQLANGSGGQRASRPGESTRTGAKSNAGTNEATNAEADAGAALGHPSLGNGNAPVVLIDYSDYQ